MDKPLTKGIILKYIKETLKEYNMGNHTALITKTLQKMAEAKIIEPPPDGNYYNFYNKICKKISYLEDLIVECYTYLIIQGIIIPAPDTPNFGSPRAWTNFKLTEYGTKWINSEKEPIPEDINGYLEYIKENIPDIDEVVIQYVSEALKAFERRLIFASAVMIGAASEKVIYLIAEAIRNSTIDPRLKKEISNKMEHRKLKELFDLISKILDKLIKNKKISYTIHEGSNHYLFSLFNAIRIQRNNAVHPIVGQVTIDQLRLLLLSFPHACRKAYDFLNWLKHNQI